MDSFRDRIIEALRAAGVAQVEHTEDDRMMFVGTRAEGSRCTTLTPREITDLLKQAEHATACES